MKIIADPEFAGIGTKCLAISWHLPRKCQVKNCNGDTYAILCFNKNETHGNGAQTLTICKKHYKEGREKGSVNWIFEL